MNYFDNPTTLQDLREQYKTLCFKHHPDISGYDSTETMKQINNDYDLLSERLAKGTKFYDSEMVFSAAFKEKIEALIHLQGLFLEIIGNWLWVTGETKTHKEVLKALDFKYAPKKQAWFFKTYRYWKKAGEKELDEIRNMYGSTNISGNYKSKKEDSKTILSIA